MIIKFNAWDKEDKRMLFWDEIWEKDLVRDIFVYNGRYIPLQFTGVIDNRGVEVYTNDIYQYQRGEEFVTSRVYATNGGFAIKQSVWAKDIRELIQEDDLIIAPLAETQTYAWFVNNCKVVGNIYEGLKIDL